MLVVSLFIIWLPFTFSLCFFFYFILPICITLSFSLFLSVLLCWYLSVSLSFFASHLFLFFTFFFLHYFALSHHFFFLSLSLSLAHSFPALSALSIVVFFFQFFILFGPFLSFSLSFFCSFAFPLFLFCSVILLFHPPLFVLLFHSLSKHIFFFSLFHPSALSIYLNVSVFCSFVRSLTFFPFAISHFLLRIHSNFVKTFLYLLKSSPSWETFFICVGSV